MLKQSPVQPPQSTVRTFQFDRHSLMQLLVVVAVCAGVQSANAAVMDLRTVAAAQASLIHQYTFEGDIANRNKDKKGTLDLAPVTYGTATASNLQYVTGFDPTTTTVVTYRPGGDNGTTPNTNGGAGLSSGTNFISFPGTDPDITVEVLFKPTLSTLPGTSGVGFVVMTREVPSGAAGVRGYFLYQGDVGSAGSNSLHALAGQSTTVGNQANLLTSGNLIANHWYYYAGTYSVPVGFTSSTITGYIADLTNGDTTLTNLGTTFLAGSPYTNGGTGSSPLAVGIADFFNAGGTFGNAFPGSIDELSIYLSPLSQATLQTHLDALWLPAAVPEPGSLSLLLVALLGHGLRRKRLKAAH